MNKWNCRNCRTVAAALLLVMLSASCGVNVQLPMTGIETGPTETVEVQLPMPAEASTDVELNLKFLAGEIRLSPGATGGSLVSGTAIFNAAELAPKTETVGVSYTLQQGDPELKDIPRFGEDVKNEWDLKIADMPMSLHIQAGAYTGRFELGGLSLEELSISEAGSDCVGTFSEPNHVEMTAFSYSTGASKTELKGLANANFSEMTFESGAGNYTLSFDGDLRRDARVKIESGVSTVKIIVPEGVNAQVTFNGGLSSVNPEGGWAKNGDIYTLSGSGPSLTITVDMGVGTLNLKTS